LKTNYAFSNFFNTGTTDSRIFQKFFLDFVDPALGFKMSGRPLKMDGAEARTSRFKIKYR
jgi:hypothetical protein